MFSPLFSSGFRPFFLLGAVYAPLVLLVSQFATGPLPGGFSGFWHSHELILGFAAAIVCGVLLTALPSWSGARELGGLRLAVLALVWLAGRVAAWSSGIVPPFVVAALDCALFPLLIVLIAPLLNGARARLFVWTLPPLVALALANGLFHFAVAKDLVEGAAWSMRLALYALAFLYSLYGGLLTPAFTRTFLRARGEAAAAIHVPIEYATAASMVLLAALDLSGVRGAWMAIGAGIALALHLARFARWRGWRTAGEPLLWVLHLGYLWFIAAIALRGAAEVLPGIARDAWTHAFTVGALGLTMIGLMTRVVLRHTGRPLVVPLPMRLAYLMVFAAALIRVGGPFTGTPPWTFAAAALLWSAGFVVYLALYAPMLWRPSLPRA